MNTTIYALLCPVSLEVKYIGQTSAKLSIRIYGHIAEAKNGKAETFGCRYNDKHKWIMSIVDLGLKPIIQPIAVVPANCGQYWEKFYIDVYAQNYTLLNSKIKTHKPKSLKVGMLSM